MKSLWNVKLINSGSGEHVYDENLGGDTEPTLESMQDLMRLIRPLSTKKFDVILTEHIGHIHPKTLKLI